MGLKKRLNGATAGALILLLAPLPAGGQGSGSNAQIPRTPDGKPDFSGIWQVINTANWNIQDHTASLGVPGGIGVVEGDEVPYIPAAAAKKK